MKSRGLFPHRATRSRGNMAGGSAGNSSSNNRPPDGSADNYEIGMTGWRSSRMGGGQSASQKIASKPLPTNLSMPGHGGFAYDASAAKYLQDKGRPTDAYAETDKSGIPIKQRSR